MKRTVLSMAEENFDFSVHDGNVTFSTERIEFVFVDDKERNGSFTLFVQSDTPILGTVTLPKEKEVCRDSWQPRG